MLPNALAQLQPSPKRALRAAQCKFLKSADSCSVSLARGSEWAVEKVAARTPDAKSVETRRACPGGAGWRKPNDWIAIHRVMEKPNECVAISGPWRRSPGGSRPSKAKAGWRTHAGARGEDGSQRSAIQHRAATPFRVRELTP